MISEYRCLPGVRQINNFRVLCHKINYGYPNLDKIKLPLTKSIVAGISHRIVTLISVPANIFAIGISLAGMLLSTAIATSKIAIEMIFTHKVRWPTTYSYFRDSTKASCSQIFKNICEIAFEHFYRISRVYEKIIIPLENTAVTRWKTFPIVEELNQARLKLRDRARGPWIAHKVFSFVNIPFNVGAIGISAVGIVVTTAFLVAKVALYVFIAIQIKRSTRFVNFYRAFYISNSEIIKNVREIASDFLFFIRYLSKASGFQGALIRTRDFANNAFNRFYEALVH